MTDDLAARARRRTTAVVAAAAAAVLVFAAAVAAVVVALGHRGSPMPERPATAARPPSAGPAGPASAATSAPAPGGGEVSWTTVAGAKVPVSRIDGPHDTAAGRARGFTRTPMGAVLAAAHISLRLSPQVGPAVFEATLAGQVVGADQVALREHLQDDYQAARAQLGLPYGDPAGQLYSTARGYRVDVIGGSAEVTLLIEGPGPSGPVLVALSMLMRWLDGDWALVAPPGGDWGAVAEVASDPTGYTRFPGGGES